MNSQPVCHINAVPQSEVDRLQASSFLPAPDLPSRNSQHMTRLRTQVLCCPRVLPVFQSDFCAFPLRDGCKYVEALQRVFDEHSGDDGSRGGKRAATLRGLAGIVSLQTADFLPVAGLPINAPKQFKERLITWRPTAYGCGIQ